MKLYNPHTETVKITYVGVDYSIDAESTSEDFSKEVATRFKTIYGFLEDAVDEAKKVTKETKKESEDK